MPGQPAVGMFQTARRPSVFIVGAPKSGTTAMSNFLGAHPDIFMARKEMHVFGSDLQFAPHFYRRNLAEYTNEFSPWKNQRVSGEASVWYLLSENAAEEIYQFNPDARILIMLREPVEMMYSLYHQFRYDGNEHLPTFEEALAAEDGRRAGKRPGRRAYLPQGLQYREAARYTEQVRRYFQIFGRARVKVILYDDFAANTPETYRQTLKFLGMDAANFFLPDFKVINGNKGVRSSFLQVLLRDPRLWAAALTVRTYAPRFIFTAMQQCESRLRKLNDRPQKRAPLPPALRAQLAGEFATEVNRLGDLLGRSLAHWKNACTQTRFSSLPPDTAHSAFA